MQLWHIAKLFLGLFLGAVLFVTLVIAILRKKDFLQSISGAGSYKLIQQILLFAFIIAVVGMVLFGVFRLTDSVIALSNDLATTKGQNIVLLNSQQVLSSTNRELLGKVSKIQELSLKEQSGSIEVLEAEIVLDLTSWKLVPERDLESQRVSLVVMHTRRRLWRAKQEFKTFPATYGTSSKLDPVFRSDDRHPVSSQVNTDRIPSNKESLRRWLLEYDISGEERFQPFDVTTEIREWNAFQNPQEEHDGTLILFPTRWLTYKIIFPPTKHANRDSVKCYFYGLDATSKRPIASPTLEWAPDGSWVLWRLNEPRLLLHYEIWWDW